LDSQVGPDKFPNVKDILSSATNLTDREKVILKAVIQDYIHYAHPVSSQKLHEKYIPGCSPATIRNTLASLEKRGFLEQPHTSAGRIPTDEGYRCYVDSLMKLPSIQPPWRTKIEKELFEASIDITRIMDKAAQLLGELSRELGVSVAPSFAHGILEKIEMVPLTSEKILVVLEIKSGLVRTVLLEMETEIKEHRVPLLNSILNERLCGLRLAEIIDTIRARFVDFSGDEIIRPLVARAPQIFNFTQPGGAKLAGTLNLIAKPDFPDMEKLGQIVAAIESGTIIAHICENRRQKPGIVITIGSENEKDVFFDCSIVTKNYHIGDSAGLVAIFGPRRMNYRTTVTLVNTIADTVTSIYNYQRRNG